jgi:hypothetical protein
VSPMVPRMLSKTLRGILVYLSVQGGVRALPRHYTTATAGVPGAVMRSGTALQARCSRCAMASTR